MHPHDPQDAGDLDEHRAVSERIRSVSMTAPPRLRAHVEGLRARDHRGVAPPRRRLVLAGGLAVAAVVALLVAFALPSGSPGGPTAVQAAALGTRPALSVAPGQDRRRPGLLTASEGGVAYPYWEDNYGWNAAGVRGDRLAGHRVTTVFYERAGRRIAYSIVGGEPLDEPAVGTLARGRTRAYRLLGAGGRRVVTWEQGGHTCVLSGRGVSAQTLLRLAWWHDRPAQR